MNEEIRQAILQLLGLCKVYQSKAQSQDAVLAMLTEITPADRASWNPAKIQEAIANAALQIDQGIELEAAALEQALANDNDFLRLLRTYVSSALARKDL
jgi:hypothetical protein